MSHFHPAANVLKLSYALLKLAAKRIILLQCSFLEGKRQEENRPI